MGLPVSRDEVTQSKAGEDTLKKVRTLQRQLDVAVDEATALAITEVLDKRGLTAASRSFTVTGTVRLRDGKVKKRQQLLAFDLDLSGVAVYRDIENLSNIQKNSGFEFLGQTTSDNRGNYRVTFYDWQYGQAERKKADVVAYALEGEEIIGRSRLVNSEDYSDKGLVRDLDVIVTQEDVRTEYEVLMTALNAFLKESNTSLAEIATSRDQLIFTAGELDIEQSRIDIAASAELLAKQEERQLSHELLYGIGRQNIRLSWAALFKKHEEELRSAIAKSVKEQIISEFRDREITAFLKAIRERVANHMLDDRDDETGNTLNALLKNALPEEKQRLSFVTALRDFKGSDYREFWNNTLPATPEFEDKPELISELLLTQQLTLLTANHQVLVNELRVNRELNSMHRLFELGKSDWLEILRKTGVPDFIEGEDEEKIENYADMMQGLLNATFPTQRIAKMLENNELHIEQNRVSKSIGTFLANNDQFDFAASRIHDFDEQIKSTAGEDFEDVRSELMKMQRVFQVSASPKAMTVLMDNNLGSAYSIANIPRLIDFNTDILNLYNLSTLYRYVVFAKGLKMRVTDLCKLIDLFSASPFSTWDIQQAKFTTISPDDTYQFFKLAASTREAGFKPSVLEYIFQSTVPAQSTLGLDKLTTLQTAKAIHVAFAVIEQDHPDVLPIEDQLAPALLTPETPLTIEILTAKLSLTFQPEIVSRFMGIVEGTESFETITDYIPELTIPDELTEKYTYIESGRLTCAGIMTDTERSTLKGLANANTNFQDAVDELYLAPEIFVSENFKDLGSYKGIFDNLVEAYATLLDHPATSASLDQKLAYVYERFLPVLKSKLRHDAITQHIAALIGLSEDATGLLIAEDVDALLTNLSTEGFSATYFNDATWTTSVLEKTDGTVNFAWGNDAPDPSIPADKFSVRWKAYLEAPASGEYTLLVEVEEADESIKLYLDTELILEKLAADTTTSWEISVNLNAAQMHYLILEYA